MILDYIVKHNNRIRISECAIELGLSFSQVENTLKALKAKSLLDVFQKPEDMSKDINCGYLQYRKCRGVRDNIALRERLCKNTILDACCYLCRLRENCDIACDVLDQRNVDNIKRELPKKTLTLSGLYDTVGDTKDPVAEFVLGFFLVIFATVVLILILPPLTIIALIAGACGALYCIGQLIWNLASKKGE